MKLHLWYYGGSIAATKTHTIENYDGPIPNVGDSVSVFKDESGEEEIIHFRVGHRQFEFYPSVFMRGYETAVIVRE